MKPAGEFRYGGKLPAERWRAVAGRLSGLPPAAPFRSASARQSAELIALLR